MKKISYYLTVAAAAATASSSFAGGFALNEFTARGNAMQGAIIGSTKEASAVFYNPANQTELGDGIHTAIGTTIVAPDYDVNGVGQNKQLFIIPHLFISGKITDDIALGFGEYTEFGLGSRYKGGKDWPLAWDSTETKITSFTLSPTIAWQVCDRLSLGAGFRAMYLNLEYNKQEAVAVNPATGKPVYAPAALEADDIGYSYLLSASLKLTDTVKVGLVYREETDFTCEGDMTLGLPANKAMDVYGDLTMPRSVTAGINWQATEKLNLGFSAMWTEWSCFDSIKIMSHGAELKDIAMNWQNTWRYSVGAEYQLNDNWALQCGFTRDIDPSDAGYSNTLSPPGDREQAAFGFTYSKDDWSVGMNYAIVIIQDTDRKIHGVDVEFENLVTHAFGVSYSKTF